MATLHQLLRQALKQNALAIMDAQQDQLIRYLELMQTWNRIFNLTAVIEPRESVYLHLIDSLVVQPFLHGQRFLDVGTGAGLPGIPLAITHPEQHWVLLDKNSKKTRFLTQVIAELGLKNVEVVHGRCEDFQPSERFDSILSRAFAALPLFVTGTVHLLKPSGYLIAMKGKYPQAELDAVPDTFKVESVTRLNVQGVEIERHIVRLVKK